MRAARPKDLVDLVARLQETSEVAARNVDQHETAIEACRAAEADVLVEVLRIADEGFEAICGQVPNARLAGKMGFRLDARKWQGAQVELWWVPLDDDAERLSIFFGGGALPTWSDATPLEAMEVFELDACIENLLKAFIKDMGRKTAAEDLQERACTLRAFLKLVRR